MTTTLLSFLLGGLGYGFVSAFVPVLNAEAFVVAAAAGAAASVAWWGVVGVSLGQTAGKVAIFMLARKGVHRRFVRERPRRPVSQTSPWRGRLQAWSSRLMLQLDRTWVGAIVVLVSAAVGVPPLAVVAVVAGLRRTPLVTFTAAVLVGRLARFAALAWPVAAIAS